jgi:uncharacterized protein
MSSLQRNGSALITEASTGIGAVYAARLGRRGYDLILVPRDNQRLSQLGKEIATKTGRRAEALPAPYGKRRPSAHRGSPCLTNI